MAPGLNGFQPARATDVAKEAMLARIELAIREMTSALLLSGFSLYEAGEVNLQTRAAITGVIKGRSDTEVS